MNDDEMEAQMEYWKSKAKAAEAELVEWKATVNVLMGERTATEAEVQRLREALTEAKAQIGHGAFCNCVVCSPLIAALAAPTKEDTETVDWELDRRDVQRSLRQAPTLRETT